MITITNHAARSQAVGESWTPPKPVVAVDCDGVLSDFIGYALQAINARLNTHFRDTSMTHWHALECLGADAEAVINGLLWFGDAFGELKPLPGAITGVRALAEHFEVWIVTSMPEKHINLRLEWLERHGIPFAGVVVCNASEKPEVVKALGGVALFEDRPDTVTAAALAGIPTYMPVHPYNVRERLPAGVKVGSFLNLVGQLLLEWDLRSVWIDGEKAVMPKRRKPRQYAGG